MKCYKCDVCRDDITDRVIELSGVTSCRGGILLPDLVKHFCCNECLVSWINYHTTKEKEPT